MEKKNIALIAGGFSGENSISRKSVETLLSNIDRNLFEPYLILWERDNKTHKPLISAIVDDKELVLDLNDFSIDLNGNHILFDYAYITVHGTPGEDGILQGYLDILGIPYNTGSVLCEALTFNKYICNNYLRSQGILVSDSYSYHIDYSLSIDDILKSISLPLFVKPTSGGSSLATTKVTSKDHLIPALEKVFQISNEAMVEEFIEGREVTCGCILLNNEVTILPITEVIVKDVDFFDWDAKYHGKSEEITPAKLPPDITKKIGDITKKIAILIHARGIIRADYIITPKGEIVLLEVNTTPGMTNESFIPQQLRVAGLSLKNILTQIINEANI